MTGFELNEQIKEYCVERGAKLAVTQFFKKGVPILPEPFYETTILFPTNITVSTIRDCIEYLSKYKEVFDEYYFFTDPLIERNDEYTLVRIVYAIFLENISFHDEIKIDKDIK
jgi:hypothetical protein